MRTITVWSFSRGRRIALLAALIAATLGLVLGVAAPEASAHASLRSSDPPENAVLKTAPKYVTLTFSEALAVSENSLRVFDPDNRRVDKGKPEHVKGKGDAVIRVALRDNLPQGTFTVAWRGVSADSHPVSGAFVFSIGKPSQSAAPLPEESSGGGAAEALYDAVRYVAYGGYAVLAGVSFFVLFCWPQGAALRPLRRLMAVSWWAMVLAAVGQLLLRAPYTSPDGSLGTAVDPSALWQTLGTGPGKTQLVKVALLLAIGGLLVLVNRRFPELHRLGHRHRRRLSWVALLLATAFAATWAATEHASTGIQVPVSVPLDILHLLAVAMWLGGLAALLTVLFLPGGKGEPVPVSAVDRFSRLAFASVVVLALTGLYQSWRQAGSWEALTSTSYGRLLLIKVCVVGVMLSVANHSRGWTVRLRHSSAKTAAEEPARAGEHERQPEREVVVVGGRPGASADGDTAPAAPLPGAPSADDGEPDEPARCLRGLRRSVGAEVAVAVAVLAVTTILTGTQPARSELEEARTAPVSAATPALSAVVLKVPFDTGGPRGKGTVYINVDQGRVGENSVQAAVLDENDGFITVPEIRVTFTMPEKGIGPLDANLKDLGGYWLAESVQLPFPGKWKASVTVRTSEIDQVTETTSFTIR